MDNFDFQPKVFGPGTTYEINTVVKARPSFTASRVLTIAAVGTLLYFDGYAEDIEGVLYDDSSRWYHLAPGQTDQAGQPLDGWIHSKLIDIA